MAELNNTTALTTSSDEYTAVRRLLSWLNTYEDKPVDIIADNYLDDDTPAMSLISESDTITRRYILGGYQAAFTFRLIYRVQPDGNNARLSADEELNAFADWIVKNWKDAEFDSSQIINDISITTRAGIIARYENGDEDHSVSLRMTYEVF